MKLVLVAAASENNVIGKKNKLPWKLPTDLKHFKDVTMGKPVIMGRKTFESIGKALPGRRNIIVTRQAGFKAEGCDIVDSLKKAFRLAEHEKQDEACVIGGGEIYRQALPTADIIYFTRVHTTTEGDVTFPEISGFEWRECSREYHAPDDQNEFGYSFITYERRTKGGM